MNNWKSITKRIDQGFLSLRNRNPDLPSAWASIWTIDQSLDKAESQLVQLEKHFGDGIDDVVEEWIQTGDWSYTMPDEMLPLLGVRFETVAAFADQHATDAAELPIVPPTDGVLLRWLLLVWWKEKGHRQAAEMWALSRWSKED